METIEFEVWDDRFCESGNAYTQFASSFADAAEEFARHANDTGSRLDWRDRQTVWVREPKSGDVQKFTVDIVAEYHATACDSEVTP